MIPTLRKAFNSKFTQDKYQAYLSFIEQAVPDSLHFRIAETPIFIDVHFTKKILAAGDSICNQLLSPEFISFTQEAIPLDAITPNESVRPDCIVMDFAIALDESGNTIPKLIELQGFPSLFGFEVLQDDAIRSVFDIEIIIVVI